MGVKHSALFRTPWGPNMPRVGGLLCESATWNWVHLYPRARRCRPVVGVAVWAGVSSRGAPARRCAEEAIWRTNRVGRRGKSWRHAPRVRRGRPARVRAPVRPRRRSLPSTPDRVDGLRLGRVGRGSGRAAGPRQGATTPLPPTASKRVRPEAGVSLRAGLRPLSYRGSSAHDIEREADPAKAPLYVYVHVHLQLSSGGFPRSGRLPDSHLG